MRCEQLLGYDAIPANFDVTGDLAYQPLKATVEDLQARALRERPDFRAADLGITAAQSQISLAKANAKVDVNGTYNFTHVAGESTASLFVNFELPIFNRNQGEIARTSYALTQAQEQKLSASDTVMGDVANAYEALKSNDEVVQLYMSGLPQRDAGFTRHQRVCLQAWCGQSAGFSRCGAQLSLHAIGLSPGPGSLHDGDGATEGSCGHEDPAMNRTENRRVTRVVASLCMVLATPPGWVRTGNPESDRSKKLERSPTVHDPAGADVARTSSDGATDDAEPNAAVDGSGGIQRISSTTPVITQVSGQVSRVVVVPGQRVTPGRTDALCGQPGLFATANQLFEGEGRLRAWRKRHMPARRTCMSTRQLPNKFWSRRSRRMCKRVVILRQRKLR